MDKKTLEHVAALAKLKLNEHEEEKLIHDLGKVLDHFKELQAVDTSTVSPMTGGSDLKNAFRNDAERTNTNRGEGVDAFPKQENGFLKVPPVFE